MCTPSASCRRLPVRARPGRHIAARAAYRSACALCSVALAVLGTVLTPAAPFGSGEPERAAGAPLQPAGAAHARPGRQPGHIGVIIQSSRDDAVVAAIGRLGGRVAGQLKHVGAIAADLPASRLAALRGAPGVESVSLDRPMAGALDLTAAVVGAGWVYDNLALDGTGIGVAIVDSGVARSHNDLAPARVAHFADFVRLRTQAYDGYGHGTHVAGIIAGSGQDSGGARRGIAPGAHLVILKTLDEEGRGYISNAVGAIDYAIQHRAAFNIRVVNLSVAAGVYESYRTDPLALAAARAVDAGIVVVTAAGNLGRGPDGEPQHGGVTAPGNAPWVLTVGAASHNGTADRADDSVAAFSSLGPSSIDFVEKPDLVAPGMDIASLADPESTLFLRRPAARVWGTVPSDQETYLSLSGTSMAAPVVAGAVAVMLQANPALSPATVKAVLRMTADPLDGASPRAQGAGLLNMRAAVALAASLAGTAVTEADPPESARR